MNQIDFRFDRRPRAIRNFPAFKVPSFLKKLQTELNQYFKGKRVRFSSIPLDLPQVSEFTRKVWQRTRKIPFGSTMTYDTLARSSGFEKASRAVGTAMRRNPLPILIPCHRVMRKDGGLGGYSKGLPLKKLLLSIEGFN